MPKILDALKTADHNSATRLVKVLVSHPDPSEIKPLIALAKKYDGLGSEVFAVLGVDGARGLLAAVPENCKTKVETEFGTKEFFVWAGETASSGGQAARVDAMRAREALSLTVHTTVLTISNKDSIFCFRRDQLMRFEWDEQKNRQNLRKHDVRFETAMLVFDDPYALTQRDFTSEDDERWITVGAIGPGSILLVVHSFYEKQGEEIIRIISARAAESHERRAYEEAHQGAEAKHPRHRRKKRRGH